MATWKGLSLVFPLSNGGPISSGTLCIETATIQLILSEAIVGATGPNTSSIVDLTDIKVFIVLQMFGGIGMLVLLCSAHLSWTKADKSLSDLV
ncbi:hypothetical protein BT96DRAFT_990205 [Gymnopus androsaceus JB14]|uniref:Uncharacterized protein n=1 Tax=Gymnopus androsaceus JB14 TaxID=1447944 RepID=A0A6A4I3X8_9AGAR|nr:hypothetical protein BT96DRAFT_990205 [Gymnopus androsaceus JB14]